MAWAADSATVTIGADDNVFPILRNTNNVEVTYTSSETGVATIDSSTGEVTLVSGGNSIIEASFAGNETYNAYTAKYYLTVAPLTHNYSRWDGSELQDYTRYLDVDGLDSAPRVSDDNIADFINYLIASVNGTGYTFALANVDADGYYWNDTTTKDVALKINTDCQFPDIYVPSSVSEPTVTITYDPTNQ